MLDRLHAIRSIAGKTALGVVLASTLALAACGSTSTSTSASATATPTTCKVTAAQLTSSVTTKGAATAVSGIDGNYVIDGSSALAPLFTQAANEFQAANPGVHITVTPNGSGTGLAHAEAGTNNIGMSDVFAASKAPASTPTAYDDLKDHQVAAVVFSLVTSPDLAGKVNDLSTQQIKDIYTGATTNWSQVGGPSEPIIVVNRPTSSGTRATFKKYVLANATEVPGDTLTAETSGALLTAISQQNGAIGYVSLSFIAQNPDKVNPICIDHAKAVAADVNSGKYNFWGIEHAYTKGPAGAFAKAFLQYVESDQVQKNDLLALSYLPVSTVSASAVASHTDTGAPAPETF